jgi:DNA-binding MarR family transcriptional regulator
VDVAGQPRSRARFRVLEDFRYEIRRFLSFSEHAAREAGIEPQQHQALLSIKAAGREKAVTVGSLAARLLLQHHSTVELSERLEKKGWIRRERSGSDRREVVLTLTDRGEELLDRLSALHRVELQTNGPRLLKALQDVMKRRARADVRHKRDISRDAARAPGVV